MPYSCQLEQEPYWYGSYESGFSLFHSTLSICAATTTNKYHKSSQDYNMIHHCIGTLKVFWCFTSSDLWCSPAKCINQIFFSLLPCQHLHQFVIFCSFERSIFWCIVIYHNTQLITNLDIYFTSVLFWQSTLIDWDNVYNPTSVMNAAVFRSLATILLQPPSHCLML